MERVSEASPHLFTVGQDDVSLHSDPVRDDTDDNLSAMTPSRSAAVEEDGSDRGFPAANGNPGSCVEHGSRERTS
jgi:hypothetical protein